MNLTNIFRRRSTPDVLLGGAGGENDEALAVADASASTSLSPLVVPTSAEGPSAVVIGAGRMGQLIAAQLALRGSASVLLYDRSDFTRSRALAAVRASLMELETSAYMQRGETDNVMLRVAVTDDLNHCVMNAAMVLEAVPEDLELKREIFAGVDKILTQAGIAKADGPLLCSNSISFSPESIFNGLKHERWCNLRFLSPVLFIDEAELIADRKHTPIATALLAQLGMTCVPKVVDSHRLSRERVDLYYKRQLEYTAAQPRPSEAAEAGDGQEAPAADREAAELPDCSICLSTMSGSMLLPCGHTSTCHDCAVHLCTLVHINAHRCPICRCHIEKVLQADCPVKSSLRVLDVCGMVM